MITELFSIPVYTVKFEGDLKTIQSTCIPKIKSLMEQYDCSNFPNMEDGALCSYAKTFNIESWKELKPIIELIQSHVEIYKNYLNINSNIKVVPNSAWVSLYPPNAYLNLHAHEKVGIAIVFYLKKPKDSGNLILKNNFNIWKFYEHQHNIDIVNDTPKIFDVEEGDIVMFPAFLMHGTQVNNSNEDRIIIGSDFNLEYKD